MEIENLLKPRYEVIADYPYSEYAIGLILIQELPGCFQFFKEGIKYTTNIRDINYPHLFKKLNWWERRTESEMPKFLKHTLSDGKTTYHEVRKWDLSNPNFIEWRKGDDFGCFGMWSKDFNYMPCTEAEYLANKA